MYIRNPIVYVKLYFYGKIVYERIFYDWCFMRFRAFFRYRFNLASALTNTYLAVASALALNPKDSLFPGQRFVEAGLAGAAGAVQVAKIASTQFTSSATSADAGGNNGGAPTMSAPQFNVVGQSGVNQLASLNQQPIQAYVVSGQVTSQQSLDRNRLENATLGG
jgi:hypothetical protein